MKPKLLVVDDEQAIHKLLHRVFEDGSVELISALNGQEGVKMAEQTQPQLILLDVNMPVLDGYGAIRELRKNKATKAIPVIMFTTKDEMVDHVVGFELGVEDYITKPIDMDMLKRRVMSFFNE
jgi:DNA-binding response OmpR family regulator